MQYNMRGRVVMGVVSSSVSNYVKSTVSNNVNDDVSGMFLC